MRTYSKWTARIALVAIGLALLAGLAIAPINTGWRHRTVWPLPHHYGIHHIGATIEMGFVWGCAGFALLICIGIVLRGLFKRAKW